MELSTLGRAEAHAWTPAASYGSDHLVSVVAVAVGARDEHRPPRPHTVVILVIKALSPARRCRLLLPGHPNHRVPLSFSALARAAVAAASTVTSNTRHHCAAIATTRGGRERGGVRENGVGLVRREEVGAAPCRHARRATWSADAWGVSWCGGSSPCAGAAAASMFAVSSGWSTWVGLDPGIFGSSCLAQYANLFGL
jgi:hypothetical protein